MRTGRRVQLTLDELKERIDNYFNKCKELDEPLTLTGLCLELGVSRQTLCNYENRVTTFVGMSDEEIEEFLYTIKRAKLKIENYAEKQLFSGKNPAGIIFNLKNNYGWKDVQEVNNSTVISQKSALNELTTQEIKALLGNTLEEE